MTQRRNPQRRLHLALNHLQDYINTLGVVKIGLGWSIPIRERIVLEILERALVL